MIFLTSARKALLSPVKEVRAATIRALRYLFKDRDSFIVFQKLHIDLFLIRYSKKICSYICIKKLFWNTYE